MIVETIDVRRVRQGDQILHEGSWWTVSRVDTKDKWKYVYNAASNKPVCKVLKTGQVTVRREVLTEEAPSSLQEIA